MDRESLTAKQIRTIESIVGKNINDINPIQKLTIHQLELIESISKYFPEETHIQHLRVMPNTYKVCEPNTSNLGTKNVFFNFWEAVSPSILQEIVKKNIPNSILISNSACTDAFKNICAKYNVEYIEANMFWHLYLNAVEDHINHIKKINITDKKWSFICANRRPRPHRILTLSFLKMYLSEYIENSFSWIGPNFHGVETPNPYKRDHDDFNLWIKEKENYRSFLSNQKLSNEEKYFLNHLFDTNFFESQVMVDSEMPSQVQPFSFINRIGSDRLFHLVTETFCYSEYDYSQFALSGVFTTEKIIKPILDNQVFIVIGQPYYLKELKRMGFKTFNSVIDESYDEELNHTARIRKAVFQLRNLMNMTEKEKIDFMKKVEPIRKYNLEHLKKFSLDTTFGKYACVAQLEEAAVSKTAC